ncbi:MAG: TerC/Alx family metal homeostasis membrane protein [Bacteroidales bacterium]|nr:TerC/Alx family metal homeostasis membrane protein [Bacteroidales bacterium]
MNEIIFLVCFIIFIAGLLALDLGAFHKKDHVVTFKESVRSTAIYVALALLFFLLIRYKGEILHGIHDNQSLIEVASKYHDHIDLSPDEAAYEDNLVKYRKNLSLEYITGYFIEETLSIDNIFVMIMIFMSFGVEKAYYHRVLFYGILGAIFMRLIFIMTASALIQRFHWILLLFGGFLIYSGVKMFIDRNKKEEVDVKNHVLVKFFAKRKLSTDHFDGHNFFTKVDGRWLVTPLFIVLLVIEFSDIIFAFDSIPAIFSVTEDPYIVFMSNIFAILGLRSLFFMLESVMDKFAYLKVGVALLLTFIGVKMLLPFIFHKEIITTGISLAVILTILVGSIVLSLLFPPKKHATETLNN